MSEAVAPGNVLIVIFFPIERRNFEGLSIFNMESPMIPTGRSVAFATLCCCFDLSDCVWFCSFFFYLYLTLTNFLYVSGLCYVPHLYRRQILHLSADHIDLPLDVFAAAVFGSLCYFELYFSVLLTRNR